MTNFINWLKANQTSQSGTTLQTQGNPSADGESPATTVASGFAPAGTDYAMVWADVPTRVEVDILTNPKTGEQDTGAYKITIPANTMLELPNLIPTVSKITMTDV